MISIVNRSVSSLKFWLSDFIGSVFDSVKIIDLYIIRHFQACECMIFSLRAKFRQTDSSKDDLDHTD